MPIEINMAGCYQEHRRTQELQLGFCLKRHVSIEVNMTGGYQEHRRNTELLLGFCIKRPICLSVEVDMAWCYQEHRTTTEKSYFCSPTIVGVGVKLWIRIAHTEHYAILIHNVL